MPGDNAADVDGNCLHELDVWRSLLQADWNTRADQHLRIDLEHNSDCHRPVLHHTEPHQGEHTGEGGNPRHGCHLAHIHTVRGAAVREQVCL